MRKLESMRDREEKGLREGRGQRRVTVDHRDKNIYKVYKYRVGQVDREK